MAEPPFLRAAARGDAPDVFRLAAFGIARLDFGVEGGELHFVEEGEAVVRRAAVRAEGDAAASLLEDAAEVELPGAELVVRAGVVDDDGAPVADEPDVVVREVHAVREDGPLREKPALVHPGDGRHAVLLEAAIHLRARLGGVDVDDAPVGPGLLRRVAEQALVGGIDGVWRVGDREEVRMGDVAVGLLKLLGARELGQRVRDEARPDDGAKAHFVRDLEGDVRHPVHVVEEDGAGANHLLGRKAHAATHGVVGELGLEGPDMLVQPRFKAEVVGEPPHDAHGGVRVGVVEGRREDEAVRVQRFDAGGRVDTGADRREDAAFDQGVRPRAGKGCVFNQQTGHN